MNKYIIKMPGRIGVEILELHKEFPSDRFCIEWAKKAIPYYHPVYSGANIYRILPDGEGSKWVAQLTTKITITVKEN